MKISLFLSLLLWTCLGYSGETSLGLFAGGNYTGMEYTISNGFTSQSYTGKGFGGMGGLSLSFYQYHRFGFRLAGIYSAISVPTVQENYFANIPIPVSGGISLGSAVFDVNFDLGTNRHSFGIGYGYASMAGVSYTGAYAINTPKSTSATGVIIDAKDFWKNGWFDYVNIAILKDNLSAYQTLAMMVLGIGYEFGGHGD